MLGISIWFLVLGQIFAQNLPWNPVAKNQDATWVARHQQLLTQTQQHKNDAQLIFVGDSITYGWDWEKDIWAKHYSPRHAYNYAIAGDQTQQVICRLQNKEFDGLKPKVAVLMIGTNNLAANTIEDIAHGVKEILTEFSTKMLGMKTILLGVLPRGEPLGNKAKQLNVLLKNLADGINVHWLDMWSAFESNAKQKTELFIFDQLHLNPTGYDVWQKTMEPLLTQLYH